MAALLMAAVPLAAQQPSSRPGDWRVRTDRPNQADSAYRIEQMGPGWHFYTTTNGIAWRPALTARGNFRAEAQTFLFSGGRGHRDGYGLILGGRDLEGPGQDYLYFLIRGDGHFLIKHRGGAETHDVVPWTASASVPQQPDSGSVRAVLAVDARADSVIFNVNGQRVHALARNAVNVDGIVGLRVNHGLSVHVASLSVTPR
jgi:hypothetical protein